MTPERRLPATERTHPLTANLDLAAPGEIVALLRRAALEIFDGGPAGEPALRDERFAEGIERLGRWMAQAWAARPPRLVLITGAGTSGRLAGFLAARFNAVLSRAGLFPCFRADMAGGPEAFFRSIEGAEDDGPAGAERWRMESRLQAESSIARFESMRGIPPEGGTPYLPIGLTIGVTCGLSAPYVAGMLDAALDGRGCRAAILGFVAPQQARSSPALADGRSVRDVVERLASSPRGLVLTTELGPEPLTGSTRMKGGAATIAALCAAFLSALGRASITRTLSRMRRAIEATETIDSTLARLVEAGGRTLRHGGRIAYLGRGGAGLLGVIDASECTPTFGDDPRTVRGFCFPGGVGGLAPLLAPDGLLAGRTELARPASGEVFREMMEEALHSPWLAVQLQNEAEVWSPAFRRNAANRIQAGHRAFRLKAGLHTPMTGPLRSSLDRWAWELAVKTCLNTFTTGAHVLAGKVYGNRMIDVRISNTKLLHRAARIVAELARVSSTEARRALLTAIHGASVDATRENPAADRGHVAEAAGRSGIVARAILLACGFSLAEADRRMAEEPIVRRVIATLRMDVG